MKVENVYGVDVYYTDRSDGGGLSIYKDLVVVMQKLYGNKKWNHCFEWCAGPGFMGFSVLANNWCDKLSLGEIYTPSMIDSKITIARNNLKNVDTYLSDNFKSISENIKFDLIVSNPPHFNTDRYGMPDTRRYKDDGWKIHQDFFQNVGRYLSKDGRILLAENIRGSSEHTFEKFIHESGLMVISHRLSPTIPEHIWWLEVGHQFDFT